MLRRQNTIVHLYSTMSIAENRMPTWLDSKVLESDSENDERKRSENMHGAEWQRLRSRHKHCRSIGSSSSRMPGIRSVHTTDGNTKHVLVRLFYGKIHVVYGDLCIFFSETLRVFSIYCVESLVWRERNSNNDWWHLVRSIRTEKCSRKTICFEFIVPLHFSLDRGGN